LARVDCPCLEHMACQKSGLHERGDESRGAESPSCVHKVVRVAGTLADAAALLRSLCMSGTFKDMPHSFGNACRR